MTYRPRDFRVGKMREAIDIEAATVDASSGQPIRSWSATYSSEPAAWTPTAGTETVNGRQVEAGITAIFTVRHRDGYTTEMRVKHGQNYYGIVYVKPVHGVDRYIELHCKGLGTDA